MTVKTLKKALCVFLIFAAVCVFTGASYDGGELAAVSSDGRRSLYVGGIPFGVRIYRDGVSVVGVSGDLVCEDEEGLRTGDVIYSINGKKTATVKDISDVLRDSGGETVVLNVGRNGSTLTLKVRPYKKDGEYILGIWAKSGIAGIGTVTYVDPRSREFGGLGHGICDDSGEPVEFRYGDTEQVEITGITRGMPGAPGEIHGILGDKTGRITENTQCGVFGIFAEIPESIEKKLCETAYPSEVTEGEATLVCGVSGGAPVEYKAEIVKRTDRRAETKNFIIRVTDERLLEVTGGIVQGMSGSPVIQRGRLVGAVTHVLVADPACGYGIFIDRMLDAQK